MIRVTEAALFTEIQANVGEAGQLADVLADSQFATAFEDAEPVGPAGEEVVTVRFVIPDPDDPGSEPTGFGAWDLDELHGAVLSLADGVTTVQFLSGPGMETGKLRG